MKKVFLVVLLFTLVKITGAQVPFDALTISPRMPKAGQTINFKYNTQLSSLIGQKKVDIVIYFWVTSGYKVVEPKMIKTGTTFSGSFKIDEKANAFAFGFSSDKEKDNNSGKGYYIPIYNNKNEPITEYYAGIYSFQRLYGEALFDITYNPQNTLNIFEKGIKQHPELKKDPLFLNTYLYSLNGAKKAAAISLIHDELQQFENNGHLTEAGYNTLIQWYTRDKRKGKVDSLTTDMRAAFPDGAWKKNEPIDNFNNEKDLVKKVELYNNYIKQYPPTEDNKQIIENLKSRLANSYAKAKDYKGYQEWNQQLSKSMAASNNNNIAWGMAEKDDNIELAKVMSYDATAYVKNEMNAPTEKKPDYFTNKQWVGSRKYTYAMYADTYAFIMYKTGDYKTGYQYAKDAAKINEFKSAEYNERYSQLLEKVVPEAIAKKEIEQFVKDGTASSKTKEILKTLYVKEKKSDEGYDAYLTKLEMTAKLKKKEELAKTMINEVAPKFNLKDIDGNDISLDGLKGKVVVVDFWATWCGPCIASMPAMKTAHDQLKTRDDVSFIFVDTWETVENKKQNAADFMKKNNYPFHVLLDDENKVVTDFKVNGIPTKFVIDKTGNIRFKSVGFGGSDDALVDEVNMMIEMASIDIPVDRHVK